MEADYIIAQNHQIVLDEILANCCPQELIGEDMRVIMLEGHCMTFWLTVRLISTVDRIQYEVLSVRSE